MITVGKLVWYFHRLRAMAPEEIAGRFMEKARGWTDRPAVQDLDGFQLGHPAANKPMLPDKTQAPASLSAALAADAARLRAGHWTLFGWKMEQVGVPPRWNRDFLSIKDAPLDVSARQLDHRQLAGGADARSVWEINRWTELVRLAQNAWINDCRQDAVLVHAWLRDWIERNPTGMGINWTSPLEAALRLINFCWIDALIRACGDAELQRGQQDLATRIVPAHAWWVWRHKSFGSSANNHLLGELSAIVIAAHRWPSLMHPACCAERAWQLMEAEILRQFAGDGGNREQALHYHQFAWEMAWQAARTMETITPAVAERLRRAAEFFAIMCGGGSLWEFGDSDDARITPWFADSADACNEWHAWLERQPRGAAVRFWLGEPPEMDRASSVESWLLFDESGMAACRRVGWTLRVDGSPLGFGSMAAHGHLDAMHVSAWIRGTPLLIDPGTGAYFGNAEVRTRLASWEMHNGPLPTGGRAQPRRMGPFLWTNHHEPPALAIEGDACVVRFACDGPFLKRSVICQDGVLLVIDEISGKLAHEVIWQLAPGWEIELRDDASATARHPSAGSIEIAFQGDLAMRCERLERTVSPHFGEMVTAPALRVSFMGRLESRWAAG